MKNNMERKMKEVECDSYERKQGRLPSVSK